MTVQERSQELKTRSGQLVRTFSSRQVIRFNAVSQQLRRRGRGLVGRHLSGEECLRAFPRFLTSFNDQRVILMNYF